MRSDLPVTLSKWLDSHLGYLFLVTIIFTLGEIVRSPVTQSFVSHYAPRDARAQYMGASNLQFTIGRFLAPLTVFLSAWLEPLAIFILLLIASLISMVLYYSLFKRYTGCQLNRNSEVQPPSNRHQNTKVKPNSRG
ncbi:MAG: MFS transporter [Sporolactobacillus sp.]